MENAFVTGGSRGIGLKIVSSLLDRGYRVVVVSRTAPVLTHERLVFVSMDLSSIENIQDRCSKLLAVDEIHVCVFNAATHGISDGGVSKDGIQRHMAVNHLSHLLIFNALEKKFARSCKFVIFSSDLQRPISLDAWKNKKDTYGSYSTSKCANMCKARYLHLRGRKSISYHPGCVRTTLNHLKTLDRVLLLSLALSICCSFRHKHALVVAGVVLLTWLVLHIHTKSPLAASSVLMNILDNFSSGMHYNQTNAETVPYSDEYVTSVISESNNMLMIT